MGSSKNVVKFKLEKGYSFININGSYGHFKINNYSVTKDQIKSDSNIKTNEIIAINSDGELTFIVNRKKSTDVASWWTKEIGSKHCTFNEEPEELNFAVLGDLEINVTGGIFGETTKTIKYQNVALAQGHTATRNNWWFGGKHFLYLNHNRAISSNENQIECTAIRGTEETGDLDVNIVHLVDFKYESKINWISSVDEELKLYHMSIPGTHDSGTSSVVKLAANCQNFDVKQQLLSGIRVFDIRVDAQMDIRHTFKSEENWQEVIYDDFIPFLEANQDEFIIMLLGSANGQWTDYMIETVKKTCKTEEKSNSYFSEEASCLLQNIKSNRKKIIVIRRQSDCPFGILLKFEDNKTFSYNGFCVEDEYKQFDTSKKAISVKNNITKADLQYKQYLHPATDSKTTENQPTSTLYITFNSISTNLPKGLHTPYEYAWGTKLQGIDPAMNPKLLEIINSMVTPKSLGLVLLDFYDDHGDKPELVNAIISANNPK